MYFLNDRTDIFLITKYALSIYEAIFYLNKNFQINIKKKVNTKL